MEDSNRAIALIKRAQRRLKEVTLDFGGQFAGYYRRRIDVLCEEIFQSLEQNNESSLNKAEENLQDLLYKLDREIRLQYEDDFFFRR